MSKILYTEAAMSFEEKSTWIYALVSLLVCGSYFFSLLDDVCGAPSVDEIAYGGRMVATIVLSIVVHVIALVVAAIASPKDANRRDERDVQINRFGEYVGSFVFGSAVLVPLGLAMIEAAHFWIANAIYASFVIGALASSAVKIFIYRRGA